MSDNITTYIILIGLLIFITLTSLVIGFFEGPQVAHYINLISIILNLVLTLHFIVNNKYKLKQAWRRNSKKLMVAAFATLLQLGIAIAAISIKYGYTNWIYNNTIELITPV